MRDYLRELVADFERNDGKSLDEYWSEEIYHPMAEGKYLLAISSMYRSQLLSEKEFGRKVESACGRLEICHRESGRQVMGFGLGFPYKESGADDAFLITNCIVLHGLVEVHELCQSERAERLIEALYEWIRTVEKKDAGVVASPESLNETALSDGYSSPALVPCFSEQHPALVANAVAYWIYIVNRGFQEGWISENSFGLDGRELDRALAWVDSHWVDGFGWRYTLESDRIDLVHQCYIANGTFCMNRCLEMKVLGVLTNFVESARILDKLDVMSRRDGMVAMGKSSQVSVRFNSDRAYVTYDASARDWSVGEGLTTVSRFFRNGTAKQSWKALRFRFIRQIQLLRDEEARARKKKRDLRGSMHLAHGLASSIETDRKIKECGSAEIVCRQSDVVPLIECREAWATYGIRDPMLVHSADSESCNAHGQFTGYFNARDREIDNGGRTVVGKFEFSLDYVAKVDQSACFSDGQYAAAGSVVRTPDGSLYLFYSPDTARGFAIATSTCGTQWERHDSIMLEPRDFGCTRIGLPSVVFCGERWVMLFEGICNGAFRIFGAESDDLKSWIPMNNGKPLFHGSFEGNWDQRGQANPSLVRIMDGFGEVRWFMCYNGESIKESSGWDLGCVELLDTAEMKFARNAVRIMTRGRFPFHRGGRLEGGRVVYNENRGEYVLVFFYLPTSNSYFGGQIFRIGISFGAEY